MHTGRDVYDLSEKVADLTGRDAYSLVKAASKEARSTDPDRVWPLLANGRADYVRGKTPAWFPDPVSYREDDAILPPKDEYRDGL